MEAVMLTFSRGNGAPLLSPKIQLDITANRLKQNTVIELLRLRGRYADSPHELDIIQAELNRRHRWENLAYTLLIAGAVILIGVLI
jgi:hypothetical protein